MMSEPISKRPNPSEVLDAELAESEARDALRQTMSGRLSPLSNLADRMLERMRQRSSGEHPAVRLEPNPAK